MFERFTEEARQVVVRAQDEARRLRHNYVGTEHLLLGLLSVDGIARDALQDRGLHLNVARVSVTAHTPPGEEVVTGQIPFTPRAKQALERSLRRALEAGHGHIGPEHVLLGLLTFEEGLAHRILQDAAVDPAELDADVLRQAAQEPGKAARCEQALRLYGAQFVCQKAGGHAGEHVEHGDGWAMRWERE